MKIILFLILLVMTIGTVPLNADSSSSEKNSNFQGPDKIFEGEVVYQLIMGDTNGFQTLPGSSQPLELRYFFKDNKFRVDTVGKHLDASTIVDIKSGETIFIMPRA